MRRSKLSDHTFQKGKFITPINAIPLMHELEDEKSWTYGRMPEYLWIGLILKYYGRDEGLRKSYGIISALHKLAPGLYTARLSQILKLDADIQKRFYDYIICSGAKEALAPLTVFLTASKAPVFAKCFYCPDQSVEDRCEAIIQTMREAYFSPDLLSITQLLTHYCTFPATFTRIKLHNASQVLSSY